TMGVLYRADDSEENSVNLIRRIKDEKYIDGNRAGKPVFNEAVALSFIIFSLLYMPCIATFITIRKMSGTWKWAIFSALYSIGVAWGVAFLVYRMALLFLPVL
ncbi:MAG: nucleoside recognition domain-containing protein, partial [Bacteroidales bacterium]